VPVQIFDRVTDLTNNPEGYALVVLVLALTVVMFKCWGQSSLFGG
jgi:hypothetical protein